MVNLAKPKVLVVGHIRKLEIFPCTLILLLSQSTVQSQKMFIHLYQDGKPSFELKLPPLSPACNLIHSGSLGFQKLKKKKNLEEIQTYSEPVLYKEPDYHLGKEKRTQMISVSCN